MLEQAILNAAWETLETVGYSGLTLEAVAQRAGTSRPVLHRRWPGRLELAVAALAHRLESVPIIVPDLGNVREELAVLLRRLGERSAPLVRVALNIGTELTVSGSTYAEFREHLLQQVVAPDVFEEVLERGVARGELVAERLTPKVRALPMTLGRHDMIMTSTPPTDSDIYEMLDEIFLPLVSTETVLAP
ncbi:TetR/AcrR family transcriptional regulator (plasmid) [Deinococcus sp. KNUC1210]|uniref:TetR/AcrR family transcriptional regulator n=1 Tax=Deinococcus sp. KNUC1210 TaxID=2917691 RepID=UPI001EF0C23B|nr:TetR/AcrR family transcriptional regulator [Deinococcus sp. KNUC1210]ULH17900.1 TetR/AcrR family transcriptional regulator [Deinococcus sp. KNUC1210]